MPQAIVGYGVTPCQVDGFPEKCERSRKGALYIRPRSSLILTNDELDFIKVKYPQLFKKLRIVEEPKKMEEKSMKAVDDLPVVEDISEPEDPFVTISDEEEESGSE